MQFHKGPSVVEAKPKNLSVSVPVDTQISVSFDKDIAKSSITSNVHLLDRYGKEVDARLTYDNRVITIKPIQDLASNHTYKAVFQGNNDPHTRGGHVGLCDSLNYSMLGDFTITFTTFSEEKSIEDVVNGSPNDIIITSQPRLRFDVTKKTNNPVKFVEVEISETNTFEKKKWVGSIDITEESFSIDGVVPGTELGDGSYYWRVRAKNEHRSGNWSDIYSFHINTIGEHKIVEEDSLPVDSAFPDDWDMLDPTIIEVYPEDNYSNVATNLKTISFVVDGIIPGENITKDMLQLEGMSVDGETDTISSHGVVEGKLDVFYDKGAGTTTIIYTLPILGGDD